MIHVLAEAVRSIRNAAEETHKKYMIKNRKRIYTQNLSVYPFLLCPWRSKILKSAKTVRQWEGIAEGKDVHCAAAYQSLKVNY